jgi:low affinity Fe/Cu permease
MKTSKRLRPSKKVMKKKFAEMNIKVDAARKDRVGKKKVSKNKLKRMRRELEGSIGNEREIVNAIMKRVRDEARAM